MKIVRTTYFEKSLKKLGASAADLAKLEMEIVMNPDTGDVIPGLGGARKVRFTMAGRGKRGGGRAIYIVLWAADTAYLVLAYSKVDQEDLSRGQRREIAAMMKELSNAQGEKD